MRYRKNLLRLIPPLVGLTKCDRRRDNSCSEWPFRLRTGRNGMILPSHPSACLFPYAKYGGCLWQRWLLNFDLIHVANCGATLRDLAWNFLILYILCKISSLVIILNYILILRPRNVLPTIYVVTKRLPFLTAQISYSPRQRTSYKVESLRCAGTWHWYTSKQYDVVS